MLFARIFIADRYVIVGNHYDAFVFGAVDPNSGTAVMLEVSNAYGKLLKEGMLIQHKIEGYIVEQLHDSCGIIIINIINKE